MAYEIRPGCSACHYCYYTCPAGAIEFRGREYQIDPEKCISCGKCEKACPTDRIYDPAKTTPPILHKTKELDTDVVIIGAGGAGMVAAVRIAQLSGRKVTILERVSKIGGSTNLGHAFTPHYTNWHKKAGMPDEREEAIDAICQDAQPGYSRELLSKAMYGLDDMFDWLCGFGGCEEEFELIDLQGRPQFGPFPHLPGLISPRKRILNQDSTDETIGPGWGGTFVLQKMAEQAETLGINIMTMHNARHLLFGADGDFQGVIADHPGGDLVIHAKACLLSSGGFSRNKKLMKKLRPSFYEDCPVHTFATAGASGDAIRMAKEAGAMLDLDTVKIPMFSPTHHPYSLSLTWLSQDPHMVMVNRDGCRFYDESLPPSGLCGPLEDAPFHICYAIFDASWEKILDNELQRRGTGTTVSESLKCWKDDLEKECLLGEQFSREKSEPANRKNPSATEAWPGQPAVKADSIAELAQKLAMDPAKLEQTIWEYNEGCQKGTDAFGKKAVFLKPFGQGPYYALFQSRFNEGAVGGVVTDDNLRMLKEDGTPFSGIYLAGDCCRGVLKKDDSKSKFGEMPWAFASGWIAANEIAEFLK